MERVCSFFGHRDAVLTNDEKIKLTNVILDLIENKNTIHFYFGGFGDFDQLCWEIVTEIKKIHPQINRYYCLEDARYQNERKRPKWLRNEDFEDFLYLTPDNTYWVNRIFFRNREMIKNSDYVIFYIRKVVKESGACKAYYFAQKILKNIILI